MTVESNDTNGAAPLPASQEKLLDAQAIEEAAAAMSRPTARMHLTALAKKLRKESEALQRVESSRAKAEEAASSESEEAAPGASAEGAQPPAAASPAPAPAPTPAPAPVPSPAPAAATPPVASSSVKYTTIDRFAFDAGSFNSAFVTLYVSLPSVGDIPRENITCEFGTSNFDLIVRDLNGRSYRLLKDNLEKDIQPDKSKFVVKADKVVVKLAKVKSEYGNYDHWTKLTDPKKKDKKKKTENPSESIMDLMKDMYDSGDDRIRKAIGEAMLKTNRGEQPGKFDAGMDGDDM